jgi:hypothetical protein
MPEALKQLNRESAHLSELSTRLRQCRRREP